MSIGQGDEILEHVYGLDVVRNVKFGDLIPVEKLAVSYATDILDRTLALFRNELSSPPSEAHLAAVQAPQKPEALDGKQVARLMRNRQRMAYRRKRLD